MHSVISTSINLTNGCWIVLFKSVFSTPANIENITVSSGKMEKSEMSLSSAYIIALTSLLLDISSIMLYFRDWASISSARTFLYSAVLDPVEIKIFKSEANILVNVCTLDESKAQHYYNH